MITNAANKRRRQRGFTLTELMIALIVVSIVALVFLWSGNSLTRTYRIRDSLRQAVGAVNYARMQAAIRNQNYRMQFCPYNSNCNIIDHSNLGAFNAVTPALSGFWFIEQCTGARLDAATCGDPGRGQELKFYDFSKAYRDVEMYQMNIGANIVTQMNLYFRPSGEIMSCARTGNALTCTRNNYHLCFRVAKTAEATGLNAIPRRVTISFSGRVQVLADNGANNVTPICQ